SQAAGVQEAVEALLEQVVVEPEPQPLPLGRSLRGRGVIVTGGATGIGRAVSLEFARQGANVAFNYHRHEGVEGLEEEAERTAREIAQLEVRVHAEACDVRDPEAVQGFVQRAQEAIGGVHVLVNNAGVARDQALWRLSDEQWRTV